MLSIKTFTLRLTEEQLKYVGEKAEEIGVSKNDYLLMEILWQTSKIKFCKKLSRSKK